MSDERQRLRKLAIQTVIAWSADGLMPRESMLPRAMRTGADPWLCGVVTAESEKITTLRVLGMSEFSQLLREISNAQRRHPHGRGAAPPVTQTFAFRMRPDRGFAKAMDAELTSVETRTGERALEMAQASNAARLVDIRDRARLAIARAMAEITELISIGGISATEVAERQILLNAFAQRMGL